MYQNHRREMGDAMDRVVGIAKQADQLFQELVGRGYGVIEQYRCDGAELVIAAMGSMTGTARDAVDELRNEGAPVGLLEIRLFRPFPSEDIRDAVAGIPKVMVMDRNFAPGTGGVLFQEIKAALYAMEGPPQIHGYLTGVGGTSISPAAIKEMVRCAMAETPSADSVWRG